MRAATSRSDLALWTSARLDLRLRRRERYDLVVVIMEEAVVVDEVVDSESVESRPRAQRAIACSTRVEIAPSLPPNTEPELELELEEEDELEDIESGLGDEGDGGSPR